VQPAFHRQRIASYGQVMVEHADRTSARWKDGDTFDMNHEMTRLTLGIVAKTLFDAEVESEADEIGEAMTCIMEMFNLLMYPFAELIEKLPLPQVRRYERMRARLDATIYRIIDERRRSGEDRGDLLSILLLAQDEEDGRGECPIPRSAASADALSRRSETTQHPHVDLVFVVAASRSKKAAELDEILRGRLPAFEDVPAGVHRMVVAESIRCIHPQGDWPEVAFGSKIGKYSVPANAIVLLSPFVTQRDDDSFRSTRFDPERWTPEAGTRPYSIFLLEAAPPCIGEGLHGRKPFVLATLASRWRARLVAGQRIEPKALITLRPKHDVRMTIGKR
jgi:cytochrome P450